MLMFYFNVRHWVRHIKTLLTLFVGFIVGICSRKLALYNVGYL